MNVRTATTFVSFAVLAACGGGGGGNGSTDVPLPPEGYDVTAVVFYDENGNGTLDAAEVVRIPGVVVDVEGRTERTEPLTGRAIIRSVPPGTRAAQIRAGSLPPFYQAVAPTTVQVPQPSGQELRFGVTLATGTNRPNTYMAFGDSLTVGIGSSDETGYRSFLQSRLQQHLGHAEVLDRGADGTDSSEGAERIGRGLRSLRPAYTLILYGTNDWNTLDCRLDAAFPCYTIESLRTIVLACRSANSLPVLATIPPGNPSRPEVPPERNEWVGEMNNLIRPLARDEGAALADIEAAFRAEGDLTGLFSDHVHPNDRGYQIMADTFFKAITGPVNPSSLQSGSFGLFAPSVVPASTRLIDHVSRSVPDRRTPPLPR